MIDWVNVVTDAGIGGLVGAGTVFGLSRWLGDVWKARIVEELQQGNRKELEALKSEMQGSIDRANRLLDAGIEKASLVTKTQFETEFSAYKELFAALSDLKHCVDATRPLGTIGGKDDEEVRDFGPFLRQIDELITAQNKLSTMSENLRPFYMEEIYQGIHKCFESSTLEVVQLKTPGGYYPYTPEWSEQGRRNQESFRQDYL